MSGRLNQIEVQLLLLGLSKLLLAKLAKSPERMNPKQRLSVQEVGSHLPDVIVDVIVSFQSEFVFAFPDGSPPN
jgi:hypothetical protein